VPLWSATDPAQLKSTCEQTLIAAHKQAIEAEFQPLLEADKTDGERAKSAESIVLIFSKIWRGCTHFFSD
jgi:hypothetical protein